MNQLAIIRRELISGAFRIGAIKIRPTNPFTWAKGWKSPIYNDNRLFLWHPDLRRTVLQGLDKLAHELRYKYRIVAGTATAGIPHAYGLAEDMELPFIYIRDKPKEHGMRNRIEGIDAEKDLGGSTVLLIEDLISTGGSSVSAVQAIRDANGNVDLCLSIFSYGFPKAKAMFNAEIPFDAGEQLDRPCRTESIIRYPELIKYGIDNGYVGKEHTRLLEAWSADPAGWSDRWKLEHKVA